MRHTDAEGFAVPAYRCAICEKDVSYEGSLPALYPFCSPRCKLVDLGRWFNEQYTIDRDVSVENLPERFQPDDGRQT